MADLAEVFLAQSRDFLKVEYRTKMRVAVESLPPADLWWRPNEQANSVGNLLVHLTGNVKQWIVGGVGQASMERDRDAEFARRTGGTAQELLANLERVLDDADAVLARLTPKDLMTRRTIQARDTTVAEAIYHVVEHFSLHLGQIIWIAKLRTPGAVRFYEDAGGNARPLWPDLSRKT